MDMLDEEEFRRDYPLLYRPLPRGGFLFFECGPGWYSILRDLSAGIERVLRRMPPELRPYCTQVKEKHGGLRFYIGVPDYEAPEIAEIDALIAAAEAESRLICERHGIAKSEPKES